MIETWKTKLSMGHKIGAIYMDLCKVFDSVNHELLVTKLKCYGVTKMQLNFLEVTSQSATSAVK